MSFVPTHRLALRAGSSITSQLHKRAVNRTSSILLHDAWQTDTSVKVSLYHRIAPFTQKASSKFLPSFKIACAAFAVSWAFYAITSASPRRLESPESEGSDDESSVDEVDVRYKLFPSNGLRAAEQILNWDSRSKPMQSGSNILRYDCVRIASHEAVEDFLVMASGMDETELKWVIAGVFDGHAGSRTAGNS